MTNPTAPRPRTKKPTSTTPVTSQDAPHATQIPQPTIAIHESPMPDLDSMTGDELDAFTAAMNAQSDAMEAALAARETALRASLRDIEERRSNACQAATLLNAKGRNQRQAEQEAAAQAQRRAQQEAYESDVEIRQRLFAKAQELTTELAGVVKDALQVDGRIYSASLALGISTQRGGYARRSLESAIGYPLNVAGLLSFPRTRPTPITYRDTLDGGDLAPAPIRENFPLIQNGGR